MQAENVVPTFIRILKACESPLFLAEGKFIHAQIMRNQLTEDISVGNALICMYGRCCSLVDSYKVFNNRVKNNIVSWNSVISAFVQCGYQKEALSLFRQMLQTGVEYNRITLTALINSCTCSTTIADGEYIHSRIVVQKFYLDVILATSLVNMYGKCGKLGNAVRIFNGTFEKDIQLWTAIIAAHAQNGYEEHALELFQQMQVDRGKPNRVTFLAVLTACVTMAVNRLVHAQILECRLESDILVGTSLIHMYANCGSVEDARRVFSKLNHRDIVTWNALIAACAEHGTPQETFELFRQMNTQGIVPDKTSFVSVLDACVNSTALEEGILLHGHIICSRFEADIVIGNALVNMYGKCGSLKKAHNMFSSLNERDVISWTSIAVAHAQHGQGKEALQLFREMQKEKVQPNKITCLCVLHSCSHTGLLDEGYHFFVSCSADHFVTFAEEHYGCMIDLMGRGSQLEGAEDFIQCMPFPPNSVIWITLLATPKLSCESSQQNISAIHSNISNKTHLISLG